MEKEEKKEELRRILPILWSSYQHMYDIRKTGTDNEVNFLLVIISFISATSIGLLTYFKNEIFFIPLLFQLTAFVILLKKFFIKDKLVHWFEYKTTLIGIEKRDLISKTFAALKSLENYTWSYLIEIKGVIRLSILFILISLVSIVLALIFSYFKEGIVLYLFILILIILIMITCNYYQKQPPFKEMFDKSHLKMLEKIDKWLNGESAERL